MTKSDITAVLLRPWGQTVILQLFHWWGHHQECQGRTYNSTTEAPRTKNDDGESTGRSPIWPGQRMTMEKVPTGGSPIWPGQRITMETVHTGGLPIWPGQRMKMETVQVGPIWRRQRMTMGKVQAVTDMTRTKNDDGKSTGESPIRPGQGMIKRNPKGGTVKKTGEQRRTFRKKGLPATQSEDRTLCLIACSSFANLPLLFRPGYLWLKADFVCGVYK